MGIGKRIKEARNALGMTQEDLAKLLGVTKGAVANYENETSHPKEPVMYKMFDALNVDANYLFQDVVNIPKKVNDVTFSEYERIKKYRLLDDFGKEFIDIALDRESKRVAALQKQAERIQELENELPSTIIDIQPHQKDSTRLIEYFHSASAGTGVFILGNETIDQLAIPDTPENRKVDYAIKVSGDSMEPDYHDGDIVLVSQKVELNHGDVGIFIINNDAYIKEYGETELISRNPEASNIIISEHDNIVCMGKVVGKYEKRIKYDADSTE